MYIPVESIEATEQGVCNSSNIIKWFPTINGKCHHFSLKRVLIDSADEPGTLITGLNIGRVAITFGKGDLEMTKVIVLSVLSIIFGTNLSDSPHARDTRISMPRLLT